ncbi:MAG: L-aspartate oxidase [Deltaproteobacteria bacterium]|nr:L-aspartate oxidase [Deltaproteobacteria bacterium]
MIYQSDFLIVGSGVAGLMFALKVAPYGSVTLITKCGVMDSNTNKAQGGIASVFDGLDSFDDHIQDTLASGDGLTDKQVAEIVVKNGPDRINELTDLGVHFNVKDTAIDQSGTPAYDLGREGGHSHNRILHAHDMTGSELQRVLVARVQKDDRITIFENHVAIDLITRSTRIKRGVVTTSHEEICCGAYVLDTTTSQVKTFSAKTTLLATGGAGKVYLYTSNPDIATGDGIAMAYRAGATVANLEFVQFHPTCLYHSEAKNFLISEAVRGEGGVLIDSTGNSFMAKYDPQKDLACRDVVAKAIDTELKKSGEDCVFLDITHQKPDFIRHRFPNLYDKCLSFGINMTTDPIPVVPAAHYMCGGIGVDTSGRADINGLYAVGESASTGLHGANRLASNSLLEALVFAHMAAKQAAADIADITHISASEIPAWDEVGTTDSDEVIMVSHNWDEIRRLMWNYVGIVRSNKRLDRAKRRIEIIQNEIHKYYWDFKVDAGLIELRNIATVAELIIDCARYRKESRGLHFSIDYPIRNDKRWKKDTLIRRPIAA